MFEFTCFSPVTRLTRNRLTQPNTFDTPSLCHMSVLEIKVGVIFKELNLGEVTNLGAWPYFLGENNSFSVNCHPPTPLTSSFSMDSAFCFSQNVKTIAILYP